MGIQHLDVSKGGYSRVTFSKNLAFFTGHAAPQYQTLKEQAEGVLKRYDELFAQFGLKKSNILYTTCFMKNADDEDEFADIYFQWIDPQNPPAGVDTSKYTVFFHNWYGQPGFRFHVYTRTDVTDPDTGYNFGLVRASRKMVAWGGTPVASGPVRRLWFYDFSAAAVVSTAAIISAAAVVSTAAVVSAIIIAAATVVIAAIIIAATVIVVAATVVIAAIIIAATIIS